MKIFHHQVTDFLALLYNRAALEKAGIIPPPATIADFEKAAEQVVQRKLATYGFETNGTANDVLPFLYTFGGGMLDPHNKPLVASDGSVNGLTFLLNLKNRDEVMPKNRAPQRYFIQGLRLAREAHDRLMGGQILSNLSHQANYLGNFSEAIQFARAAQAATVREASATVRAMFFTMEARALASIGDSQACAAVLHRAEQAFDQRNPGDDPDWISYFDAWELAGEAAHCFRDLGQPDETLRFVEQAIDPVQTPARTRAFIEMASAAGALRAGDLEQAVSIATDAVRLAGALRSSRYLQYVADLHRLLTEKDASHPSVRAFTELVGVSYPEHYSKPHAIEKKNNPRAASYALSQHHQAR